METIYIGEISPRYQESFDNVCPSRSTVLCPTGILSGYFANEIYNPLYVRAIAEISRGQAATPGSFTPAVRLPDII